MSENKKSCNLDEFGWGWCLISEWNDSMVQNQDDGGINNHNHTHL